MRLFKRENSLLLTSGVHFTTPLFFLQSNKTERLLSVSQDSPEQVADFVEPTDTSALDPSCFGVVDVINVSKEYSSGTTFGFSGSRDPPKRAVDDISLKLHKGQIVGILGHNGAGKSTLLNMIIGFTKPTTGRVLIKIDGITYNTSIPLQVEIIRSKIGVCHQHDLLFDNLTPKEHLLFHVALKNTQETDPVAYVCRILSDVGLTEKSDSRTI
jgi:ABC-type multidrug transport system ATPase subunit